MINYDGVASGKFRPKLNLMSSSTPESKGVAPIRIILHGKAASDSRLRTAVSALRKDDQVVEVRVTWEPGDAARLTAEAVAEAVLGKINCIVAGGGDGTINEVFATAHVAGLPDGCSLGIIPLGTANDFAHSAGVPTGDIAAALQIAASARSQWIDVGLLNGRSFVNLVSGGFGSRVNDPHHALHYRALVALIRLSNFLMSSTDR